MATEESANYVLLTRLSDEFASRYRAGERPSIQEYIDRYPELAGDIRELFPAMVQIEQVKEDHQESATSASPALQQLGDFRVLREVGKGGMGIVYEAEQVSLGRHVALKVLPKSMLIDARAKRRFEREAKAAAKLHHTNIVPVFGVGEQDGLPYYVMQFIQGLGLDQVLEELKKLQLANAKTATFLGGEVRISRNVGQVANLSGEERQVGNLPYDELSAALMARSLLTGEFHPAMDDANAAPETAAAAPEKSPQSDAPRSPALSDSFTPSSSSVILPNRGRDGSHAKGAKQTYWQSVASIGVQVADALEYAHKQGVQHRDIKPSNLLLDTQGTVWVADFGLAKADDQQNLTHTGDILGTLRYMPPEAFEGKTDARSDVYSLGLTLYEMLAFHPAFGEKERNRLIKQVTTEESTRLCKLNKQVPRDLETIVHKAIEKDPRRRYASAGELAEDLQRFKADEPIHARRVHQSERLVRWCRRNPAVASLAAAFLLALVIGLIGVTLQWQRAEANAEKASDKERLAEANAATARQKEGEATRERDSVRALNEQLRRTNYASQMNLAQAAWEADNVARVVQLLDQQRPKAGEPDLRGFEWYYWQRQCHGELGSVPIAEFSSDKYESNGGISLSYDGNRLAKAVVDKATDYAFVWDRATGKKLLAIPLPGGKEGGWSNGILTRDGQRLVTIRSNSGVKRNSLKGDIRLWDVATGRELLHISPPLGADCYCLTDDSLSADGTRLATVGSAIDTKAGELTVWDGRTGKALLSLSAPGSFGPPVFSPDGTRIAASVSNSILKSNLLQVWEVATGEAVVRIRTADSFLTRPVVFSPDGKRLAMCTGMKQHDIQVCNARDGKRLLTIPSAGSFVFPLVFSPDGKLLSGGDLSTSRIKVWDSATGKLRFNLTGHTMYPGAIAFSRDSRTLYSAGHDGTLRVWDIAVAKEPFEPREPADEEMSAGVISPDGMRVARCTSSQASSIEVLDPLGKVLLTLQVPLGQFGKMAFSTDNKRLAVAPNEWVDPLVLHSEFRVWDVTSGKEAAVIRFSDGFHPAFSSGAPKVAATFAVEDKKTHARVAHGVKVFDADNGKELFTIQPSARSFGGLAFSPDGVWIAGTKSGRFEGRWVSRSEGEAVVVWEAATGKELCTLEGWGDDFSEIAFSPDGMLIAASHAFPAEILVWQFDSQVPQRNRVPKFILKGHSVRIERIVFSSDGRRLVSTAGSSPTGELKLWDTATGQELLTLKASGINLGTVQFSPDGRRILALHADAKRPGSPLQVWDGTPLPEVSAKPGR